MNRHHTLAATLALAASLCGFGSAVCAQEADAPPRLHWSFSGPFGIYDQAQLQRGFKIYREVCSTCHSLKLLSFRNLADPGGPGFTEAQAAAIAATFQVTDGPNDQGQMFQRPGKIADYFPPPFPNDQTARAALGGKLGYTDAPAGFVLPPGGQYNKYFPGHAIGMPKPLSDGQVEYTDGTPTRVDQYGRDVAAFLMWAAEPTLDARKRLGFQVMVFLIVFTALLYFTKKRVWHAVLHPDLERPRAA
jgi:cytochrome c1